MNKVLLAGLVSAIAFTGVASATECSKGGVYAGAAFGWVHHTYDVSVTEKAHTTKINKVLTELEAAYKAMNAIKADEAAVTEKQKTVDEAKAKFVDALYKKFKLTDTAAAAAAGGAAALTAAAFEQGTWMTQEIDNNTAEMMASKFYADIFKGALRGGAALNADANALFHSDVPVEHRQNYNTQIKKNIEAIADKLFSPTVSSEAASEYLITAIEKNQFDVVTNGVATGTKTFTDIIDEKFYKAGTAEVKNADGTIKTAAVAATGTFMDARAAAVEIEKLKVKNAMNKAYAEAVAKTFADSKNAHTIEVLKAGSIATEVESAAKAEAIAFGTNESKTASKTPNGFVAEAFIGGDYRFDNTSVTVGGFGWAGYDSSDCKIKDSKQGTNEEDGMKITRSGYFGIAPEIGFYATPSFKIGVFAGPQWSSYKVDASNIVIGSTSESNFAATAKRFNEGNTAAKEAANTSVAKTIKDAEDLKATAAKEANTFKKGLIETAAAAPVDGKTAVTEILDAIKEVSTDTSGDNPNKQYLKEYDAKTKVSFVAGLNLQYSFTPYIFGGLSGKYQFKTKALDAGKSDDDTIFTVENQNFTVTASLGFRFF